eukprot:scaffold53_cov362-Prasinococcus_capsulatus_cf.AAC.10
MQWRSRPRLQLARWRDSIQSPAGPSSRSDRRSVLGLPPPWLPSSGASETSAPRQRCPPTPS